MALVLLLLMNVRALWLDKLEAGYRLERDLDAGRCRDGRVGTDPVARLVTSSTVDGSTAAAVVVGYDTTGVAGPKDQG